MSFAFLPFYTGDYLRDTRHLSPLRHGVYFLLLMHCWDQRGPLPLDEQECAGIANCRSQDDIEALRYVLGRFFVKMEDGWYNSRMQREVERAGNISVARSEAGKLGYLAKAKQLPSKSLARATTPTTTTITTPTAIPQTKVKNSMSGSQANTDVAKRILAFLNLTAGKRYRETKVNLDFVRCRLDEGITEEQLRKIIVKKCRDWLPDEKMRQYLAPATLFNRTKCEQYLGNLIPPNEEKREL